MSMMNDAHDKISCIEFSNALHQSFEVTNYNYSTISHLNFVKLSVFLPGHDSRNLAVSSSVFLQCLCPKFALLTTLRTHFIDASHSKTLRQYDLSIICHNKG